MARDKAERVRRGEVDAPAKLGQHRAFCTIPTTLLATQRLRKLDGLALRLLLWLEAGWHPDRHVALPQEHVAKELRVRRSSVASATVQLLEAGLITLVSKAVTPRSMGPIGPGKAAVYEIPHRRVGTGIRFDQGDQRLPGNVKLWASDARYLAKELSDTAARVAIIPLAVPRSSDGTPLREESLDLSGDCLIRILPGLTARSAYRGLHELLSKGLLTITQPHAGRRGARYAPAGIFITRIGRHSARRR
jgi:hypothetical protein